MKPNTASILPNYLNCNCSCGSWLAHWHKGHKSKPNKDGVFTVTCFNVECIYPAEIGKAVSFEGKDEIYIIPLCYSCSIKPTVNVDYFLNMAYADTTKRTCYEFLQQYP